MDFDDWQVDRLRTALNSYCALKASNGRLLPWKTVYGNILAWQLRRLDRYPKKRHPDFREEAIRRFAIGIHKFQDDKLDDLMHFLVEARLITSQDMNKNELVAARGLAVHDALANKHANLDRLGVSRSAQRVVDELTESVELRVVKQPFGSLSYVEERCRVFEAGPSVPQPGRRDAGLVAQFVRKGFAVGFTQACAINVFVWGPNDVDHRHYLQVQGAEPMTSLSLLCTGDMNEATGRPRSAEILIFERLVTEEHRA